MNSDALAARIGKLLGSSAASGSERFPSPPPPAIPNHEMLARIGAGSYGEVWLARSVTGAMRAVKVVWRSHFASDRPYEREFHGIVQFEPISRSHPGVVNILHVGRDDAAGCFFYVMELADAVQGSTFKVQSSAATPRALNIEHGTLNSYQSRTLASELKTRGRLPVSDVVTLGVQLAGALGHLHRHQLVHRDVKPSNVIFVNGQPKLADIGLVTGVHDDRSFVGTEGFIPPEGPGTERADLFALGRLLYEAVTGKNRCDFPGLPDDLDRWPKGEREGLIELNEVLARACSTEAKKRHHNAAELAGDLNLILAGRSVRRAYRIERQLRLVTWISIAAFVVVLATLTSNWLQRRQRELSEAYARREAALRQESQHALARAEIAERESKSQLYAALLEQARATVRSREVGQRTRALDAIRRAALITPSAELRREALAALSLPDLAFEREIVFEPDTTFVQFDPAFERIAVGRGKGPIELRAVQDNRLLATLAASTNLPSYHREWSADGRFLAVKRDYPNGGREADWEIWDVGKLARVLVLRKQRRNSFAFHPTQPRLIAAHENDGAAIWDLERQGELVRFPSVTRTHLLRFSPEGDRFAAIAPLNPGMVVSVYDAAHPLAAPLAVSPIITETIATVEWHPAGLGLAVTDRGSTVRWMDALTGETSVMGRHKNAAVRAVFSPDGRFLFTGGWERELICWDAQSKRREFGISLNSDNIQFSADGRLCALLTQTSATLYRFERPEIVREMPEDLGGMLRQAAFSHDGKWLAASGDKHIGLWDLASNGPGTLTDEGSNTILFFTPDGQELIATRSPHAAPASFRWRITRATNAAEAPRLTPLPLSKPKGFASLSLRSNTVVLTAAAGSQVLAHSELTPGSTNWRPTHVGNNGVSPDARWLGIYRSYDTALYVYRLPGLERVAKLTQQGTFGNFEFSPRGDEVAVGSVGSAGVMPRVEFWSVTNWQRARILTGFSRVHYTSDRRVFWLTKDRRNAGLYDARTIEPLLLLPTDTLPLALSPDGRYLAASADMQRVQVWDLMLVEQQLHDLGLGCVATQPVGTSRFFRLAPQ